MWCVGFARSFRYLISDVEVFHVFEHLPFRSERSYLGAVFADVKPSLGVRVVLRLPVVALLGHGAKGSQSEDTEGRTGGVNTLGIGLMLPLMLAAQSPRDTS